ncbi:gamma-glutamyltranspeptidase [Hygrophoropsis aurantiaca]|uniref:Gamma-glutamyltranspeptidase n=1 Tax=Hygrophoropsis aurantiaca TaxID=72124 RepID=A0ACB8ASN3_9AGAM|nr:gamma-glutamyltranspeptidase [Hygrophoropsis aurantiaca]
MKSDIDIGYTSFPRDQDQVLLVSSEKSSGLPLHTHTPQPQRKYRTTLSLAGLAALCALAVFLSQGYSYGQPRQIGNNSLSDFDFEASEDAAPRQPPPITAQSGAVASQNMRCSDIGVDIMKDGGNAVDAAIGAAFCIGVVNMFSAGIGGGGFMTVRLPPGQGRTESEVWNIDFREAAPTTAHRDMYVDDPLKAQRGGLAVGVPGEVRGLRKAYDNWGGGVTWRRIIQPSIDCARNGWPVHAELNKWTHDPDFINLMKSDDWSPVFAPNGDVIPEKELIKRTRYADTLDGIANAVQGDTSIGFYNGAVAASILQKIQSTGGIITQADLDAYTPRVTRAIEGTYRGKKVYTSNAPSSGPALLHMFNVLERFSLNRGGRTGRGMHLVIEAMKYGHAARTKIGDILTQVDRNRVAALTTKVFGTAAAANITEDTHPPEYYNPEYDVKEDFGTSHISAVDKNRMAVALTHTVNHVFGSQLHDPTTGIILNNQMDDFSIPGVANGFGLQPSPYNYPAPHKRPASSTVPTILEHGDGSFYMCVGGVGGSYILGSVFQVIVNAHDWRMQVDKAIGAARTQDQLYPLETFIEDTLPFDMVFYLYQKGHNISLYEPTGPRSDVQAILQRNPGVSELKASSDWRTRGGAAGYSE